MLSPFLEPESLSRDTLARVRSIVASVAAFDVELSAVRQWPSSSYGPGVVWLQPVPPSPFVELTRRIWRAFPDYPPYGRDEGVAHDLGLHEGEGAPARADPESSTRSGDAGGGCGLHEI